MPTSIRLRCANKRLNMKKDSATGTRLSRNPDAHRSALHIPGLDLEFARISAYRRYKPFTQLAGSGKVLCTRTATLTR
jgi:hypothetical protein